MSRLIPATGGINKETPNNTLSPHYFLHNESGSVAIAASVDFLIGKGECNIRLSFVVYLNFH